MKSKCYILDNGANNSELSLFVQGEGEGVRVDVPVYGVLVVHPLANIVFDTGIKTSDCVPGHHENHRANDDQWFGPQLEKLGYTYDDIDYVVNSHLHWDHCGNNFRFKNARVITRPEEWDYARQEAANEENIYFRFEDLDHEDINYVFLERGGKDFPLLEGITILSTPGHTAGTQSLMIDTEEGTVVAASDSIYIRKYNYEEGKMPGICYNEDMQRATIKKLQSLGDIILLPGHDPYLKLEKCYG